MASQGVSGKTTEELAELREWFETTSASGIYEFEEVYCLAKIPRQPEGYDGPVRYCSSRNTRKVGSNRLCKHHGGAKGMGGNAENLIDPGLAGLKHGMKATRETLLKSMDEEGHEWQRDLYEWVVDDWPEAYNIEVEEDPQAKYEFHALAVEIVRAERAEGYILGEGEKGQKKIFGPDGSVHYEDVPHYLSDMIQRQRKLIMKMEDNLGISRKARLKNDEAEDVKDLMKSFAEVGATLITGADKEYDPGEFEP